MAIPSLLLLLLSFSSLYFEESFIRSKSLATSRQIIHNDGSNGNITAAVFNKGKYGDACVFIVCCRFQFTVLFSSLLYGTIVRFRALRF
ncbi:hypothetical protein ACHAWC_003857, partial [Mediolabrus comicus]